MIILFDALSLMPVVHTSVLSLYLMSFSQNPTINRFWNFSLLLHTGTH